MTRQEKWLLDGYDTVTAVNTQFTLPIVEANRFTRISPDLTCRKLYVGLLAPGAVIDKWRADFVFKLLGQEVARIPCKFRGAAVAGTAPALTNQEFAPSLPFVVVPGGTQFDYPPLAAADARIVQVGQLTGGPPFEAVIMYPTCFELRADEMEFSGEINLESAVTAQMRLIVGITSEKRYQ